jgi:hypothetical protein
MRVNFASADEPRFWQRLVALRRGMPGAGGGAGPGAAARATMDATMGAPAGAAAGRAVAPHTSGHR